VKNRDDLWYLVLARHIVWLDLILLSIRISPFSASMMPAKMTAGDRTKPVRFHPEIAHLLKKEPQEILLWLS
jgi:hypothetical protein